MRSAADGLRASDATTILKPATTLFGAATGIAAYDASAAGSLGSPPSSDPKAADRLATAVDAIDAVIAYI